MCGRLYCDKYLCNLEITKKIECIWPCIFISTNLVKLTLLYITLVVCPRFARNCLRLFVYFFILKIGIIFIYVNQYSQEVLLVYDVIILSSDPCVVVYSHHAVYAFLWVVVVFMCLKYWAVAYIMFYVP